MANAKETTGNFSYISCGKQSFLIMEQPKDATLNNYYRKFTDHNVKHVVRVCPEVTYDTRELGTRGIECHAFPYADGHPPPEDVTTPWLALCERIMKENKDVDMGGTPSTIAVHCIAGLGRAPVLVAIALIAHSKMDYLRAVETIRDVRRGAINKPQVDFLKAYEKKTRKGICSCQ